jgi:hypothetical protein
LWRVPGDGRTACAALLCTHVRSQGLCGEVCVCVLADHWQVFVEKYITNAHHVEVQIFGDGQVREGLGLL